MNFKFSLVVGLLLLAFISCSTPQRPQGTIPKTLVLGLDGVSYELFQKMQASGYFRNFNRVSPMLASFPSISDPNWTRIMALKPEASFTKAYFDPTVKTEHGFGEESGGITTHLSREPAYERRMDFKVDGIWEHMTTFLWTETTAKYWLESLSRQFFNFRGRDTFFALIINTDLVSHTLGEERIIRYLSEIDKAVSQIQSDYQARYKKDLEVVLVSDHGNAFLQAQDIPYAPVLGSKGWNLTDSIDNSKDVGFYVPEMLGFGAFYCQPSSRRDLAHDLATAEGVHSTMFEDDSHGIHIFGAHGDSESVITFDTGKDVLRYKVVKGKDIFDQEKLFAQGPLTSEMYFRKTLHTTYPNAFVRIWEGFNENTQIKSSVLASAQLGYVFGNSALRLITSLRGFNSTHGSLHKNESFGIFVSTVREFPAVRSQDIRKYIPVADLR